FDLNIGGATLPSSGVSITGSGAVDTKHQQGSFTVDLGALASLAGSKSGQIPKNIQGVYLKNVFYLKLPSVAAQISKGKEWIKIDPKTLPKSSTGGINPGAVKPDPTALARLAASVHV